MCDAIVYNIVCVEIWKKSSIHVKIPTDLI